MTKAVSRRKMIKLLTGAVAAAAGLGAGAAALLRLTGESDFVHVDDPTPTESPPLDMAALGQLVSVTLIANPPAQTDHYLRMFRVRGQHAARFEQRYTEAVIELDRRARHAFKLPFEALAASDQRDLIEQEISALGADDGEAHPALRDTIQDILRLYMHTDAYIAVGYTAWPGIPRGLDAYQQPEAGDRHA